MSYLILFMASFLAPIRFAIALSVTALFVHKRGLVVSAIISGLVAFVFIECLLMTNQATRVFGQGALWAIPASLAHGIGAYYLVSYFKSRKKSST